MREVGLVPLVAFSSPSRGKCQKDTAAHDIRGELESKDSLREQSGGEALNPLNPLGAPSPRRGAR
jgi:hypothetical protein